MGKPKGRKVSKKCVTTSEDLTNKELESSQNKLPDFPSEHDKKKKKHCSSSFAPVELTAEDVQRLNKKRSDMLREFYRNVSFYCSDCFKRNSAVASYHAFGGELRPPCRKCLKIKRKNEKMMASVTEEETPVQEPYDTHFPKLKVKRGESFKQTLSRVARKRNIKYTGPMSKTEFKRYSDLVGEICQANVNEENKKRKKKLRKLLSSSKYGKALLQFNIPSSISTDRIKKLLADAETMETDKYTLTNPAEDLYFNLLMEESDKQMKEIDEDLRKERESASKWSKLMCQL